MRQNVVRRFKTKAGAIAAVVLDQKASVEELQNDSVVVVLSRRDLVWLQAFFAALEKGRVMDFRRMRRAVTENLDAVTAAKG